MMHIRAKYAYNKVHTVATCVEITKHLAEAEEPHDIRKEKLPSGMANAVEEGLN